MDIWKELRDEGVDSGLLDEVRRFREAHSLTPEAQERVPVPKYLYYGREVWESAAAALLCGEHLLLAGPKATGKNVLAEDLAALFGRPVWDVSMYVNVDGGPDRRGHAEGRAGGVPGGTGVRLCAAGRLRRAGRGEHGKERGAGRAARHAGPPARH